MKCHAAMAGPGLALLFLAKAANNLVGREGHRNQTTRWPIGERCERRASDDFLKYLNCARSENYAKNATDVNRGQREARLPPEKLVRAPVAVEGPHPPGGWILPPHVGQPGQATSGRLGAQMLDSERQEFRQQRLHSPHASATSGAHCWHPFHPFFCPMPPPGRKVGRLDP